MAARLFPYWDAGSSIMKPEVGGCLFSCRDCGAGAKASLSDLKWA